MHLYRWTLAALAGIMLVGCGPSAPPPPPTPVSQGAAMRRADPRPTSMPPAPEHNFRVAGPVERRADGIWLVDGTPVLVNDDTLVLGAPGEGGWVTVEGRLAPDGARRATLIGAVPTLEVIGPFERVEGERWLIDGTVVQVGPEAEVVAQPRPGEYLRAIVRIVAGDPTPLHALRITRPAEIAIIGTVDALDNTTLVVDGRPLALTPESLLAAGLAPGALVRVSVRVEEGPRLVVLSVALLSQVVLIDGVIEDLDDGWIVVDGRRLRIDRGVLLSRVVLVIGQRIRLVLSAADATQVVAIIAVRVEVSVQPVPLVVPQPPPAPAPRGNDDDDDDD
ncbi:MAG: hypothetical protein OHK0015_55750 [Chloroflexi bacterium OHK40]